MLPIDEVQAKTKEVINHTIELNETVAQGAVKATKEVGIFYKRIIEGKPTDHYHITNAFKKILANNIAAAQQYFKSFRV
ncbi:MAG: hypothetical protein PHD68_11090 [Rugosibacter sp.]|nr:hypothetical protein [Rugosibacter sp.]